MEKLLNITYKIDKNIMLKICSTDYAKKTFENAGISDIIHIRVSDLGLKKFKSDISEKALIKLSKK